MPNKNTKLRKAQKNKKDEFYTQLSDIENELRHYKKYFKGKTIFCNCDDPYESNFFKYFAANFNHLGLKKLIATCYSGSPISGTQLSLFDKDEGISKTPHKIIITEVQDENNDGAIDLADVEFLIKNKKNILTKLKGDGDFRSQECINLLKQADIVITNPPFSLFREYVAQLIEYDKKFIIIGSLNAITYKEIFGFIKENKIWLGYGFNSGNAYFAINEENEKFKIVKFRNCTWYTNIEIDRRKEELVLYKKYTPQEYPKYDNYDAINVDKTADIPYDYDGIMGVPISFLQLHNPSQFEIIGCFNNYNPETADIEKGQIYGWAVRVPSTTSLFRGPVINGKAKYFRILIKRRK